MSGSSLIQFAYLALFSQPACEREIYRAIRKHKVSSIVEIGIGKLVRARRLIAVAQRYAGSKGVTYTGVDLFEGRPDPATGLKLKEAHQQLKAIGVQVKLIPGDPLSALSRTANALQNTDLLVISHDPQVGSLEQAWFYMPRMLHQKSLVFLERREGQHLTLARLTERDVEALAATHASVRRAA